MDQGNIPVSKNQITTLGFCFMLIEMAKSDPANSKVYVIASAVLVGIYMVKDYFKHKGEK